MREFLNNYGVWAAFILALFENDVAFIAVGVVAKLGDDNPATPDLNLYAAIPAAVLGALIHDTFWFALGHLNSERIRSSRVYLRIGPMIERVANRFGAWELLIARFIYGTRNPSSVFWGIHRLPWMKFAGIEVLGLSIWGSILAFIGFHSTAWAIRMIGRVEGKHHPYLLGGALALAFVIVAALRYFNRRGIVKIEKKVEAREHAAEDIESKSPADTGRR